MTGEEFTGRNVINDVQFGFAFVCSRWASPSRVGEYVRVVHKCPIFTYVQVHE